MSLRALMLLAIAYIAGKQPPRAPAPIRKYRP